MTKFSFLFRKPTWLLPVMGLLLGANAAAGFSSIYVFGDGVSTTTQNPPPLPTNLYFGSRYCDGLVWVEVLSQSRGITYAPAKNISYYGHYSSLMVSSVNNLAAPADAATSLFIIWCANADFVKFVAQDSIPPYNTNLATWQNAITQSVNNHVTAVNTLRLNKGAKAIMIPTAADIMKVPFFSESNATEKAFIRARIVDFNNQLASAMNNLVSANPELTIVMPDVFAFLDQVLANPSAYGMRNPPGQNVAISTADPWNQSRDFVFWDEEHPTAMFQAALANFINNQVPSLDTTPPVLTLPGNLVKAATVSNDAVVTFNTSAVDAVDGPVATQALPASGSTFPVGTTTVNVSASDAAGNVANGSFTVTVVNMGALLKNISITPAGAGSPAISGLIQGGPPSGAVILQASTDLGVSDPWRDLATIQLDAVGNQAFGPIQDSQGAGLKRDFFRIKLPLSP
jgi:phospholipase/lecithinase/hemolysin